MQDPKTAGDTLLIPRERVKGAKLWTPGAFTQKSAAAGASAPDPRAEEEARAARALEAMRIQARQDGFAAGFADGRALAEHEANRLAKVAQAMETALAGLEQTVAGQLLGLAISLARNVIRHELATSSDALLSLVQDALRSLHESNTGGEILVNPTDADLVKDYLQSTYSGNWRVIGDPSVEAGGCRITTRACDIDATLETRWRRALQSMGRTDGWQGAKADV